MAAYLVYILRMRTLFRGWPIMVNDTHTKRRRIEAYITVTKNAYLSVYKWNCNPVESNHSATLTSIIVQFLQKTQ